MNTTKGSPRGTSRTNAVVVGVLFVIGTTTGIIAAMLGIPILDAPDYLTNISANESQIIIWTFLVFLMGVACAGIGLALYPIMKKYSTGLAIGVVGFRVAEGILEILGGVSTIGLLALSQEYVKAGAPDAAYFQTIGAIIQAGDAWLSNGAAVLLWCIGALMYYTVFYQYRLVPRWLSGWGLIGITLTTIAGCAGHAWRHPWLWDSSDDRQPADHAAGNRVCHLADRERDQPIRGHFRDCKNSDERAFERRIDLQYGGEGGHSALLKPSPLSYMVMLVE